MLVVHRIISIDGDTVITAGDNNDGAEDEPINIKQINGEVIDIIPNVGLILKFFKSPLGIFITVFIASGLLVLSYKSEKKEKDEELDSIKLEIEKLKKEVKK